jgi:hypothetical protein
MQTPRRAVCTFQHRSTSYATSAQQRANINNTNIGCASAGGPPPASYPIVGDGAGVTTSHFRAERKPALPALVTHEPYPWAARHFRKPYYIHRDQAVPRPAKDDPARIRVLRPQLVSFASHPKHAKVATANDVRERAIRGLHVFAPTEALTGSECHSSEPASSSKL